MGAGNIDERMEDFDDDAESMEPRKNRLWVATEKSNSYHGSESKTPALDEQANRFKYNK